MSYGKNLTGEKKATFTSVDVTGLLSIENGSFVSSGNILSSGSMSASHAEFDDLYASRFYCNQATFNLIELDSNWVYSSEILNLSVGNACFTTLNGVPQQTFAYIANLSSDAQNQIDKCEWSHTEFADSHRYREYHCEQCPGVCELCVVLGELGIHRCLCCLQQRVTVERNSHRCTAGPFEHHRQCQ